MSVATDGQGRTWVAKGTFSAGWKTGAWRVSRPAWARRRSSRPPAPGGSGFPPTSSSSNGTTTASETLARPPDWPAARSVVQHLFEDSQGILWIATRRSGLFQFAGGQLQAVPTQQQRLSWVSEDSEQGIWVASLGGGVTRLQRRPFVSVYPGNGQTDIASTAVCEDPTGAVWCANRTGGVVRSFGGAVEHVREPPGEPALYANSVSCDAAGTVWVGASSGLYRVRPGLPPTLESVAPQLRDIHVLYGARNGELWVGSGYAHLGRIRQGAYQEITAAQGYDGKFITALAETADGRLWIASEHELYTFAQDRLVRVPELDGFSSERLNALHGDQANALWLGTSRGLLRLDRGRLTAFSQASGLPNERIEQILEDDRGMLWLGSRRGFFYAPRADLEAVADGRRDRFDAVTFGPEAGLQGQVPVPNCQPNTWKGRGDRLWFCTQQGVIGIAADEVPRRLPPPPVYLDRVLVDGRAADTAPLRLPAGGAPPRLLFLQPELRRPGEGPAPPSPHRLRRRLDRNRLRPGGELHRPAPRPLYPRRRRQRLQRDLARGGGSLALLPRRPGLVGDVVGARPRPRRPRRRDRLARAPRLAPPAQAAPPADRAGARAGKGAGADRPRPARRSGWQPDPDRAPGRPAEAHPEGGDGGGAGTARLAHPPARRGAREHHLDGQSRNNSLDRLAAFVRQFALRFFRDSATVCTVSGVEEIPPLRLTPEVQHHLLSATKEALNNVLKHAQAATVALELHLSEGVLRMLIRDTGVGFNPLAPEIKERNGLTNMASRIREIGGSLDIRSVPGVGTTVSWQVPLAPAGESAAPSPSEP